MSVELGARVLEACIASRPSIVPQFGHTALHRAAAFGAVSCLRVLRKAGASLETKNNAKETALDTAKGLNNEVAAKLLEAFAEGESHQQFAQNTPSHGPTFESAKLGPNHSGYGYARLNLALSASDRIRRENRRRHRQGRRGRRQRW